ncbi:homeobox protein abdominal-B isoform X2 [Episyrphus balteatus]|uniref:homeobox protein abdominal-B isoform X2 n=1 Tax=Episyrphus balteatus TaxID=286459 RepID=UPI0024859949|nr:homeobox protein abdominal-B isoform X2 [Episyrphus balteatus]
MFDEIYMRLKKYSVREVSNENYFGGAYKVGSTLIIPKIFNRNHANYPNFTGTSYGSHAAAGTWWGAHHHHHHHPATHNNLHNHPHAQLTTHQQQQQTTPTHSTPVMYEDPPIIVHQQQQQHQQQQHQQQQQQQQSQQLTQQQQVTPLGQRSPQPSQQQQQSHLTSPHHHPQHTTSATSGPTIPGSGANPQQQQQQTAASVQQQQNTVASGQTQIVAPTTASVSPASVSSQPPGPLHIPAIRPGFEADASVKRHPHPWAYDGDSFPQYHQQYYIDRDRKPVFYPYPEQFQPPYWNYRDQTSYLNDDRHASVTAGAAARQSVEGGSQSSYETPTYSSPGALRAYPTDAYATAGSGLTVGPVGQCTPPSAMEWTTQVTVRKKRKPYSKFQTIELEKEFLYNAYVSKQKRWELARNLNLTERQVKIWFQNRRMKNKKNSQRQVNQQNNNNSSNSNHNHGQAPQQHPNAHHLNLGLGMGHHTTKMHQ